MILDLFQFPNGVRHWVGTVTLGPGRREAVVDAMPTVERFLSTQVMGAQKRVLTPEDGKRYMTHVLAMCRGQGLLAIERVGRPPAADRSGWPVVLERQHRDRASSSVRVEVEELGDDGNDG